MKLYAVYARKDLGVTYFTEPEAAAAAANRIMEEFGTAYLARYDSAMLYLTPEEFCKAMNGKKWHTHYELLSKYSKPGHASKKVEVVEKKNGSARAPLAARAKNHPKQKAR